MLFHEKERCQRRTRCQLGGSPIDNEYDPLMYGIQHVEGIDYETLSLFTSTTDKACLRDLLNSRSFVGEAKRVIKEFLSD